MMHAHVAAVCGAFFDNAFSNVANAAVVCRVHVDWLERDLGLFKNGCAMFGVVVEALRIHSELVDVGGVGDGADDDGGCQIVSLVF